MENSTIHRSGLAGALLIALALGCGGATAEGGGGTTNHGPPPPAPTFTSTHVLTGPDGARVEIAEFGTEDAYLKIMGVRSPVAGIVFPITVRQNGRRLEYTTIRDGQDYYPIHKETGPDGSTRWTLYAPGLSEGLTLEWSEELSPTLDANALHATFVEQSRDGTLEAIQRFDREAAQARNDEALARDVARTGETCGATPEWSVDWSSVSDEILQEKSIAGYCGSLLQAFRNLCRFEAAKAFVATIDRVECSWIDDSQNLSLTDGTVTWQVSAGMTNGHQKAADALLALATANGDTLAQALAYEQSSVCRSPDGEHILIVHPHRQDGQTGISYGTTETVYYSPQDYQVGRGWFFDPRQQNEGNSRNFRGFDLRFFSHVDVEGDSCQLTCGERESAWTLLSNEEARTVIRGAESRPTPFDREPYALARDRRGIYYYVDRGNTPETRRDFHVYRGRRGQMERLQMTDIVSDSEGEIFATASGSLRLLVDSEEGDTQIEENGVGAHWIERDRPKELRRIPIAENYKLIMEELGVYLGERFELPCDDH